MPHLDPDTVALLALGETVTTDADDAHLAQCPDCRDEVAALTAAVEVGRHSLTDEELASPDARVWQNIATELGLKRRRPRRRVMALVAAAAAIALFAGVAVAWQVLRPVPVTLIARATLTAFPAWPSAGGSAVLEEHSDGTRTVTVTLEAPAADDAFREAWLITSDSSDLVSLGVMGGTSATFDVPSSIDISRFDLVDVSQEAYDGNPAHSGNSIVRGALEGTSLGE